MTRIEKTVFISYRRANVPWALAIYQNLTMHGYDVFFDYQSIDSGNFEKVILENIKARAHFLIILTPSALERCKESGDWLRREIETALDGNRNIVPLMLEGFDFGSPLVTQALTGKISALSRYNGLKVYSEYFFEAMDKLRDRYLSVALSNIALSHLNVEAEKITEAQKIAASEAPSVEKEQLTAQEWQERGFSFVIDDNFDEAIRCLDEAINLDPKYAEAYFLRGLAKQHNNDLDNAFVDYDNAVHVKPVEPNNAIFYLFRGQAFERYKDDKESALNEYNQAIHLDPEYESAYFNRASILEKKKDYPSAMSDYQKYLELADKEQDSKRRITVEKK